MTRLMTSLAKQADAAINRGYLRFFRERSSLITLLFHGFFQKESEIALNLVSPQQRLTVEHFRQIVDYYLAHGYEIISPDALTGSLDQDGKYLLLTFDDGYFSSRLILPVLKEYAIPGIFFPSMNHAMQNKCFWWDVLWRERLKRGASEDAIRREQHALRTRRNREIEEMLLAEFGDRALEPIGDVDRPMNAAELKNFASEKEVFIGNHTMDHAMLPNYSPAEAEKEIRDAQAAISALTGIEPSVIAYPDGQYTDDVIHAARKAGLEFGITTESYKNYPPLEPGSERGMRLGRFIPVADGRLRRQLDRTRSDVTLRRLKRSRHQG